MTTNGANSYKGSALPISSTDRYTEMEAFDRLGPLTKKALNEVTFKFTASLWTRYCGARGIDPRHPYIDQQIASSIYRDEKIGIATDPQVKP